MSPLPELVPGESNASEAFSGREPHAVGEFGGANLFAALEFDGLQAEECCVAAGDEPVGLFANESAGNVASCSEGRAGAKFIEKGRGF